MKPVFGAPGIHLRIRTRKQRPLRNSWWICHPGTRFSFVISPICFILPEAHPQLLYSRPGSFWPDVFVTSRLPWNRFAQSAFFHVAFVICLWGSVQLWPQSPQVLDRPVFNRSDVIYYAPSEYLPPLDTGNAHRSIRKKASPSMPHSRLFRCRQRRTTVSRPSSPLRTSSSITTCRLPNIVAWSENKAQPAVPMASTTSAANLRLPALPVTAVAPAPETMPANRERPPTLSQTVVAPAPNVNAESSRTLRAPQAAIVQPPPSVDALFGPQAGRYQYWALPDRGAGAGIARSRAIRSVRQNAVRTRVAVRVRPSCPRHPRFRATPVRIQEGGSFRSVFIPQRPVTVWPRRQAIAAGLSPRLLPERRAHPALLTLLRTQTGAMTVEPVRTMTAFRPA